MFSNQIAPVNVETLKIQKGSRREERVLPPKEAWYTICCTWSWYISVLTHTYIYMYGGRTIQFSLYPPEFFWLD